MHRRERGVHALAVAVETHAWLPPRDESSGAFWSAPHEQAGVARLPGHLDLDQPCGRQAVEVVPHRREGMLVSVWPELGLLRRRSDQTLAHAAEPRVPHLTR